MSVRFPLSTKLDPIWWIENADDAPPTGTSQFSWWLRNPFHNFCFYVVGVSDQATVRYGIAPTQVFAWGWKWNVTRVIGTIICLPFLAYLNPNFRAYIGWRPGGAFGLKLNISSSGAFTPP